ncbi:MAG TPA: histidine kinase, partial [Longimicrobium sp.]|nr:histidine kinase [Longimicrobium sp.]
APRGGRAPRRPAGFWYLQLGGWIGFGAAMGLGRVGEMPGPAILLVDAPFAALGFLATLALYGAYAGLRVGEGSTVRTVLLVFLLSYLAGMLWTAVFHRYLHGAAVPLITRMHPGAVLPIRRAPLLDNTVYNTLTLVAWSTLYVGLLYRDMLQAQRDRALRAAAEARDAQLRMLAYQLNPHFLFNTLNSLRAMIDEDRDRARDMVTELARFLRYALVDRPLHLAPLREEVASVRGYLAIEAIRFEDRLDVRVEVTPAAAECRVPAFLLNPLVENAIKHGRPSHPGAPLRVRLHAGVARGRLQIVVENSGTLDERAAPERSRGGIGLRNVRERLEHHHPGSHRFALEGGASLVRVTIDIPAVHDATR